MSFSHIIVIFVCISVSEQYGKIDGIEEVTIYNDLRFPVEVVGQSNYCMYSQNFTSAVHIGKNNRATFYAYTTNGVGGGGVGDGFAANNGDDGIVWLLQGGQGCDERSTGNIQIYLIKALYYEKPIMECRMRVYIYWWNQVRFCEITACSTYNWSMKVGMHARAEIQQCGYGTYDKPELDVIRVRIVHY